MFKPLHRGPLRPRYLAATATFSRCCPVSQRYHQRTRNEGKTHVQAVLALARQSLNALWAMARDNTSYEFRPSPPGSPQLLDAHYWESFNLNLGLDETVE